MSHITGDLLIAISKSLPRVFSNLPGSMSWSVSSLEKEPTIDGEIYNVEITLLRMENMIIPIVIDQNIINSWNHKLLTEHAVKYKNRATIQANIQLNDIVRLRIERPNQYVPFTVSNVSMTHEGSRPQYDIFYISAGMGEKATGYPEFDSRHEDLFELIHHGVLDILNKELPKDVYKLLKIEVSNNWLDSSTFEELKKSAIVAVQKLLDGLEEEYEMIETLTQRTFIANENEMLKAKENGENVISRDQLRKYLEASTIYEKIDHDLMHMDNKVNKIRHNEAAQAVKTLSQSLVTSARIQNNETHTYQVSIAETVAAAEIADRNDVYVAMMNALLVKIKAIYETLIALKNSYDMFIDAGNMT